MACCCRPTSGSLRSERGSSWTTPGSSPARSALTATTLAALTWDDYSTTLTLVNLTNGTSQAYPLYNGYTLTGATDPYANEDGTVATDGPLWSPDGNTIWVPQTDYVDKYTYNSSTSSWSQADAIWLCNSGTQATAQPACDTYGPGVTDGSDIPAGMALSPDGSKLYVALNGSNALGVIDTSDDQLIVRSRSGTPRARL